MQQTASGSAAKPPNLVPIKREPEYRPHVCAACMEYLETEQQYREHMAFEKSPERIAERGLRKLTEVGVLKEHLGANLTDFSEQTQRRVKALLARTDARGLLATGSPGTGKTRLMVAICREMLLQGKRVEYVMARAFFRRLWSTYKDGAGETEEQAIAALCSADLLAIDDLGHEGRVSEAVVGALHEVLSNRHGNYKPTVITTNLSIEEIARNYDASIASRLEAWLFVLLEGKDRRAEQ